MQKREAKKLGIHEKIKPGAAFVGWSDKTIMREVVGIDGNVVEWHAFEVGSGKPTSRWSSWSGITGGPEGHCTIEELVRWMSRQATPEETGRIDRKAWEKSVRQREKRRREEEARAQFWAEKERAETEAFMRSGDLTTIDGVLRYWHDLSARHGFGGARIEFRDVPVAVLERESVPGYRMARAWTFPQPAPTLAELTWGRQVLDWWPRKWWPRTLDAIDDNIDDGLEQRLESLREGGVEFGVYWTTPKGVQVTLEMLWQAREDPNAVAIVFIAAALWTWFHDRNNYFDRYGDHRELARIQNDRHRRLESMLGEHGFVSPWHERSNMTLPDKIIETEPEPTTVRGFVALAHAQYRTAMRDWILVRYVLVQKGAEDGVVGRGGNR